MRKLLKIAGGILLSIVLIPFFIVYIGGYYTPELLANIEQDARQKQEEELLNKQIIGILAREIEVSAPKEALKAQAVMIRTYLMRRQLGMVQQGQLEEMTLEEMKALWKSDFDENYSIYQEAVSETNQEGIYYNEEMIEPVYHKESGGKTRGAENVYGVEIPYLQAVESLGDGDVNEVKLEAKAITQKLQNAYSDILLDETNLAYQIQIISKDASQYITKMQVGNKLIEGEEFRKLLGLDSSHFEISSAKESLIFKVKGKGHGVGLSQKGAIKMAEQGKTYQEILKYYFTGIEIKGIIV